MIMETSGITEIILHVGMHKTGTTSIQNTLSNTTNNKLLEKKDYLYPLSWPNNHSIPIFSAFCEYPENYHINIKKGYSITEITDINKRYLESLKMEIAKREQSKLIISGEDISVLSIDNLNSLKKYLKSISTNDVSIKVVVYVRNPVSWSTSVIQQRIKGGTTYQNSLIGLRADLKNYFINIINKFIQVFGKESINIYTFEEAIKHKYGPVGYFLSTLGFSNQEISQFNIIKANESISFIAADILSFLNEKIPVIKDGKLDAKRTPNDFSYFSVIKGPKFDLPFTIKKELFQCCQDDIKWLNENFGIDYLKLPQVGQINHEFTEEIIEGIKKVYNNDQLSIILKSLVLDYLHLQLKNSTSNDSKLLLKNLLNELEK
jgi:hypothetical protein